MNENEKQGHIKKLRERKEEIIDDIQTTTQESNDIQDEFNSIKDNVRSMVNLFLHAKFQVNVANQMNYDDSTQFNENNITSYLCELEEYIANLITYLAYKRDDTNAAISSVPLEKMTVKEFKRDDLVIDAPIDHEILTEAYSQLDQTGDMERQGEDKNYSIINSKDLYNNYNTLN